MNLSHVFIGIITFFIISHSSIAAIRQQAYVKASNTGTNDQFGWSLAVDGDIMVVGAWFEDSNSIGVNGNQTNNIASDSGAAYIFARSGTNWAQQAYLKASNTGAGDYFGASVAVSGNTVVIGASREDSGPTGVNGNGSDNSVRDSGAAYVFVRNGTAWTQQAYLKAFNIGTNYIFGVSVGISGETIVIGATYDGGDNGGAAHIFVRTGTNWTQQAYLRASNAIGTDAFGTYVAISGNVVVVGAPGESSNATGVNGNRTTNTAPFSGAAFVFARSGTNWTQEAYLKASNAERSDSFGSAVAVSGDTIVVGARFEASSATGMNGDQTDNSGGSSGAAYVFTRNGTNWIQQAYLKASNTGISDQFGWSVGGWGDTIVVGAAQESSNASGVNGNQSDDSMRDSGAAYVFVRDGTNWTQQAYLKASNTEAGDYFGASIAVSGETVIIGATGEDSSAVGINGNQMTNNIGGSGATYVFTGLSSGPKVKLRLDESGGYSVRCNGITGFRYELQQASNVIGPWTSNATITALVSGPIEFHETNAPDGQAFYRVVQH